MKKQIIDVVAPASSASAQEIKKAFAILKKMNFQPRFLGPKKTIFLFCSKRCPSLL